MTRKKALITSLILVFVSVPAFANDEERQLQQIYGLSLHGLKGVYILIEHLPPNIKEHGLTEGQIKTDTEIKLRAAGIRVIPTMEELRKEAGKPWLYIAVNTSYKPTLRFFSFSIDIKLQQQVRLERNPTVIISATTWATGSTGAVGENDVQQIRGFVKDLVDKFINAYLTANPKK